MPFEELSALPIRLDARQPHGRHNIRIGARLVGVILKTQQRERRASSGLVRAPLIKHEELKIGHAARFFHPQGRCDLHGVVK
jgi:hypothetical protein